MESERINLKSPFSSGRAQAMNAKRRWRSGLYIMGTLALGVIAGCQTGESPTPDDNDPLWTGKLDEVAAAACTQSFGDAVWPVLEKKCYLCHKSTTAAHGFLAGDRTAANQKMVASLIDLANPPQSKLLLKPLGPAGGTEHMGGSKFKTTEDENYKLFLKAIQDYAVCKAAADAPVVVATEEMMAPPEGGSEEDAEVTAENASDTEVNAETTSMTAESGSASDCDSAGEQTAGGGSDPTTPVDQF